MFKFLKSLKPGGKSAPSKSLAKVAPKVAKSKRPTASAYPPDSMTPLSAPLADTTKTDPPQFTQSKLDGERPMTPERAELIKKALTVHRTQQNVFADLDDEARHKLVLMAMLSLLKEARGEK